MANRGSGSGSRLIVLQFMALTYCRLQMRERVLDLLERLLAHAVSHPSDLGLDGRRAEAAAREYLSAMRGEAGTADLHLAWLRGDDELSSSAARYAKFF